MGRRRRGKPRRRRRRAAVRAGGTRAAAPPASSVPTEVVQAMLQTASRRVVEAKKPLSDDFEIVESKETKLPSLDQLTPMLKGVFSRAGMRFHTRLCVSTTLSANSGLGKYLQFLNGVTAARWGDIIANTSEFSVLDSIFDEFFIRSCTVKFVPRNKYSGGNSASGSASGSPGDLNAVAATIVFITHSAPVYADASTAWQAMTVANQHRIVNLADGFTFTARNPIKFAWDGMIGDQSASYSNMGWNLISVPTKYGGYYQVATPVLTAATAAVTTITASGVFGDVMYIFDVAFRARG